MQELRAKLEAASGTADEVGAQLAVSNSHWRRLLRALRVADPTSPAVLVQGKEHEVGASCRRCVLVMFPRFGLPCFRIAVMW